MSDTFLDSAWYHLRYPSTEFDDRPFDPALTRSGCRSHLYRRQRARRAAPAVRPLHHHGAARAGAPALRRAVQKFRAHGLIVKDGAKMSKTRGNVVIPDEYINRGAPTRSGCT